MNSGSIVEERSSERSSPSRDVRSRTDGSDDGSDFTPRLAREDVGGLAVRVRLRALGIREDEASLERDDFTALDERARAHLEAVGGWFVRGYRAALAEPELSVLAARLDDAPYDFRGFAYEGAGTALTVLDTLVPTRRRLRAFLRGPGLPYAWMLPIGYGWARMQLGLAPRRAPGVFDPLQGWVAFDGAGFQQGFTRTARYFERQRVPRRLSPEAARVFDQGLGRSLWFVRGGDVEAIARAIYAFPAPRRGDLWSGLASAATYAGGVEEDVLVELRRLAGDHLTELAIGAAVATKARLLGGNPTAHTERACAVLCETSIARAARCADAALEGNPLMRGARSPYEAWRARIGQLLEAPDDE